MRRKVKNPDLYLNLERQVGLLGYEWMGFIKTINIGFYYTLP